MTSLNAAIDILAEDIGHRLTAAASVKVPGSSHAQALDLLAR